MKVFIVLTCLVAVAFAATTSHIDYEWEEWKATNQKTYYDAKDEVVRRDIWMKNLEYVDQHNKEEREGLHSFTLAMNKFADLEGVEFEKLFLGSIRHGPINAAGCSNSSIYVTDRNYGTTPTEVDWRTKGYVTGIKDQGACGSCWAFSTIGSVEGQHFKATSELVSLSEQNLMDCSRPEGDFSCEGGVMDYAFDYIITNGGVDTEESYPYTAMDENNCMFKKSNIGATIKSCVDVTPHMDEGALLKAVADVGPISIAIDASKSTFHLYSDGVYDEPMCSSTQLDHGVLAVGYGTDQGKDYWIVKNSWGVGWGMKGFIKMSRNKNNQCGIATRASYPVV